MTDPFKYLIAFVTGQLPVSEFEERIYNDPEIEAFLTTVAAPKYSHAGDTLYHYLIALDYSDPGDILNAHGAISDLLTQRGAAFTQSKAPAQALDLLVSAQPRWVGADPRYLASLLATAPALKSPELKAWLQARILELFKHRGHPPRWIQSPAWPVGPSGPLVFLGQLSVPDYFHDEAAVYVFHDPATGECTCVLQVA